MIDLTDSDGGGNGHSDGGGNNHSGNGHNHSGNGHSDVGGNNHGDDRDGHGDIPGRDNPIAAGGNRRSNMPDEEVFPRRRSPTPSRVSTWKSGDWCWLLPRKK